MFSVNEEQDDAHVNGTAPTAAPPPRRNGMQITVCNFFMALCACEYTCVCVHVQMHVCVRVHVKRFGVCEWVGYLV